MMTADWWIKYIDCVLMEVIRLPILPFLLSEVSFSLTYISSLSHQTGKCMMLKGILLYYLVS